MMHRIRPDPWSIQSSGNETCLPWSLVLTMLHIASRLNFQGSGCLQHSNSLTITYPEESVGHWYVTPDSQIAAPWHPSFQCLDYSSCTHRSKPAPERGHITPYFRYKGMFSFLLPQNTIIQMLCIKKNGSELAREWKCSRRGESQSRKLHSHSRIHFSKLSLTFRACSSILQASTTNVKVRICGTSLIVETLFRRFMANSCNKILPAHSQAEFLLSLPRL